MFEEVVPELVPDLHPSIKLLIMSIELHPRAIGKKMKGGAGTPPEIAVKED